MIGSWGSCSCGTLVGSEVLLKELLPVVVVDVVVLLARGVPLGTMILMMPGGNNIKKYKDEINEWLCLLSLLWRKIITSREIFVA
jgi:hypothetical protein